MHARRSLIAILALFAAFAAHAQAPLIIPRGFMASVVSWSTWDTAASASEFAFYSGNLEWTIYTNNRTAVGTRTRTSGKYYFEFKIWVADDEVRTGLGYKNAIVSVPLGYGNGYGYSSNGTIYSSNTSVCSASSYTDNDIISVAVDLTNKLVWFAKNGSWQCSGNPAAGTGGITVASLNPWLPAGGSGGGSGLYRNVTLNVGKTAFTYTPPSGFEAWH